MTNEAILALLKFAGPVVGLLSALWSTTQKITYEAEGGVKRLTLQGRVMIGIIIASGAISLVSLGLETMVRQAEAGRAAKAKIDEERRAADRRAALRAERRAEAAAREQKEALLRLEADAAERQRFLEQRFLILGAAAEQQRRDTLISQQVAREANQRLADAARTFAEIERINYPLRDIAVSVQVAINLDGVDISGFWERLKTMQRVEGFRWRQERRGEPAAIVSFGYDQLDRMGLDPEQTVRVAVGGTQMRLAFLPPGEAVPASAGGTRDEIRPVGAATSGDAPISFAIKPAEVTADIRARTISATFRGLYEPAVEGVVATGDKLSLADVDRLVPILTIARLEAPRRRRQPDTLGRVSVSLNGQERFGVASGSRIAGSQSFILSPKRR